MKTEVRELLALAAYNQITRKAITKRAGIAATNFTHWRTREPQPEKLSKAWAALHELIAEQECSGDKVEG
jgi:hypothetical protein